MKISRKYLAIGVIMIICVSVIAYAQTDVVVQLLTSGTLYVYERHYSYDGVTGPDDISIDIPCEVVRDRERQTAYIYGVIAFPDGDGSGDAYMQLIPSRGEDWKATIAQFTGDANGIACLSFYYIPIYPGSKLRITWTNPGTVKWNLTIFTRGIVN